MKRTGKGSRNRHAERGVSTRSRMVWGALATAMTLVGGALWALQGAPAPRLDGLSLPALVAAAGPSSSESAVRTRVPLAKGRWTSIVVHHSGSIHGTPAGIEAEHRAANLDGLGYHFVIGNGRGMGDGEVYVGYRWLDQLAGAHVAEPRGDQFNRTSIGICLVGDGRRREFTDQQLVRLVEIVNQLRDRLGIPADRVYLHSDLVRVDDPGRLFPSAAFRDQVRGN